MSRPYISVEQQRDIIHRSHRRCEYCQCPMDYSSQSYAIEHIVPVAKGGKTELDNLALACGGCNAHKYTKTGGLDELSKAIVLLYHPRRDRWYDHFAWSPNLLEMVGLTAVGRVTIDALRTNRSGVINLRQLLLLAGKHPPTDS